ncbi:MAG TPA: helix-turn-helix domain-containing protein [Streptosporangiaceae bacterium]|nr:helix-turn-helix domain-containing protein [Streptosporangiaceae bacterium]
MGVRFSTDDVPERERYDYWRYMHRETFAIDYRFPYGRHDWFRGRCVSADLGAVRAAVISAAGGASASAGQAHRGRGAATDAGTNTDAYDIKFSIACERFVVEQDGRQAELRPGDFAITDLTRTSTATGVGRLPKRVVSLIVPRTLLPLPPREVARLTAVRVSGRDGAGELASTLLRRVVRDLDAYGPAEAARVSTALLDLITAALAGRLDLPAAPPPDARRAALLRRVYAFVDRHLDDPGLSPATIAAAHHISVRQLHKLFEAESHTAAEWIRRRRLDRCMRDLADPALAARSVGAIAARWGFADQSGFYRLFRRVHGAPPGEYRQRSLAGSLPAGGTPPR